MSRRLLVDGVTYSTIQDAVDAAELLSESDTTDMIGVTVVVPAGTYSEDVLIRKNVNISGQSGGLPHIQKITYRPTDSDNGPQRARVLNVVVSTLEAINETAENSDVYHSGLFSSIDSGLEVIGCELHQTRLQGCLMVSFRDCTLGQYGANDILILNSYVSFYSCVTIGNLKNVADDSDASHSEDMFDSQARFMYSVVNGEVEVSTLGSSDCSGSIFGINSYIPTITQNDNTGLTLRGGFVETKTVNGGTHFDGDVGTLSPYTPANPGDWTAPTANIDQAIDQLAARLKALEP